MRLLLFIYRSLPDSARCIQWLPTSGKKDCRVFDTLLSSVYYWLYANLSGTFVALTRAFATL